MLLIRPSRLAAKNRQTSQRVSLKAILAKIPSLDIEGQQILPTHLKVVPKSC